VRCGTALNTRWKEAQGGSASFLDLVAFTKQDPANQSLQKALAAAKPLADARRPPAALTRLGHFIPHLLTNSLEGPFYN
jgi:hypothetical protein